MNIIFMIIAIIAAIMLIYAALRPGCGLFGLCRHSRWLPIIVWVVILTGSLIIWRALTPHDQGPDLRLTEEGTVIEEFGRDKPLNTAPVSPQGNPSPSAAGNVNKGNNQNHSPSDSGASPDNAARSGASQSGRAGETNGADEQNSPVAPAANSTSPASDADRQNGAQSGAAGGFNSGSAGPAIPAAQNSPAESSVEGLGAGARLAHHSNAPGAAGNLNAPTLSNSQGTVGEKIAPVYESSYEGSGYARQNYVKPAAPAYAPAGYEPERQERTPGQSQGQTPYPQSLTPAGTGPDSAQPDAPAPDSADKNRLNPDSPAEQERVRELERKMKREKEDAAINQLIEEDSRY